MTTPSAPALAWRLPLRRAVLLLALAPLIACNPPESSDETRVRAESVSVPLILTAADPTPDPCWDQQALLEGRGDPARQDWFNHLDARGFARARMACHPYFWGTAEWECLDQLWREESGWNHYAQGAGTTYGIPQSYPGYKLASAGEDWRTNPRTQVLWGLTYIQGRYGAPTGTPRRCHAGY